MPTSAAASSSAHSPQGRGVPYDRAVPPRSAGVLRLRVRQERSGEPAPGRGGDLPAAGRFVMGSVEPLLEIVAQEVAVKLEVNVEFDLSALWAHDLAGRASAFKALFAGGVGGIEALATSGLPAEDAA